MPSHNAPRVNSSGPLLVYLLAALLALGCTTAWAADLFRFAAASGGAPAASTGITPVALNVAALREAKVGSTVTLNTADGRAFTYVLERSTTHDDESVSWIGVLQGYSNDYRLVLTYGAAAAFGRFITPDGMFLLETGPSGTALVDIARSGGTRFESPKSDALPPPIGKRKSASTPPAPRASPSPYTIVEVLVLYSPGLVTRLGSIPAVITRVNFLVTLANQAYADSNVSMSLRVLQITQINGVVDNTDNEVELNAITNGTGVYAGVGALRDAIGADMVTLIRPFLISNVSCGIAWIGGFNGSDISQDADFGYSVVSDGRDPPPPAPSYFFCEDTTYAHELGHNMGSMHDRITDAGAPFFGAFPYSFGYGINGSFVTVMGYRTSFGNAPYVAKFSNPNITCMGVPCGIPASNPTQSADNAQSLNNTRDGVASWRAPVAGSLMPTASGLNRSIRAAGGFPVVDWFDMSLSANRSYELQIVNVSATTALTPAGAVVRYDYFGLNQLQDSSCLDAGCTTRTLRWISPADSFERLRVVNGASSTPPGATYTTQLRETTLYCPRWSQANGQSSVLAVQRAQSEIGASCGGTAYFYDANGVLLGTQGLTFGANKVNVQPLSAVAGLPGNSGALHIAHTCGVGGIKGIVTALEPATGFSFGTPCSERTR